MENQTSGHQKQWSSYLPLRGTFCLDVRGGRGKEEGKGRCTRGGRSLAMVTKQKGHQLALNLQQLAVTTVSLPIFGFLFCIFWSYLYNFEVRTMARHRQLACSFLFYFNSTILEVLFCSCQAFDFLRHPMEDVKIRTKPRFN